ncbi:TetR/AcrR family transcriptional regulator [Trueperella bialowiezensis]|uniref:Transcriptional regulator BetI n=1 Tax=Trueperella bialowiezensis TaxID=312285 RepID=A0A448PF83_9ACTO|nr:TetR/AcrR family transcriptional regulator [Trueperella bialowiezensis]VEI13576.1 transcriptional regulator BetI [Trueperella bialowiezensis]
MPQHRAENPDRRNTRWEAHRSARRRELLELVICAVHSHGPDASMDQIADTAKTSKSILYKYFTDKETLQYAVGCYVIGKIMDDVNDAIESGAVFSEILERTFASFVKLISEYTNVYRFMRVAELEDDPSVAGCEYSESSLVEFWSRLFYSDKAISSHPLYEGTVYMWVISVIGMVKSVARVWIKVREITEDPEKFPNSNLTDGQRNFAQIDQERLTRIFVSAVMYMAEDVTIHTYTEFLWRSDLRGQAQ